MNLTQALEMAREIQEASERATPGPWDGDCCYGNYDDAHQHGVELGEARHSDLAAFILGPVKELVERSEQALREWESPVPDHTMRRATMEALRAALRALDETEEAR